MNKKFMVVALMAALSSVGYAANAIELSGKYDQDYKTIQDKFEAVEADKDAIRNELNDKVGGIQNKLDAVEADKDAIRNEVAAVDGKVNGLHDKLDAVEADKDAIRNEVAAVDGKVNGLHDKLDAVEADKDAIRNEVAAVDGKVNGLHDKLDAVEADKDAIRNEVAAVDGKVNGLHDKLDAVEADKDAIRNEMETADKNLQGQIDTNKEEIGKLDQKVDDVKHEIYVESSKVHDRIDDLNEAVVKEDQKLQAQIDQNKADQKVTDDAQDGKIETNKNNIAANAEKIEALQQNFAQYDGRLSGLEKKVDHLDDKMNKGLSLMAAMNAVDFQNVQTGEMALGAGIGHYGNAQSVALGVAYAPVEDLTVNAKYSITAGDPDSFAVGAGATYKFKVGR